LIYGIDTCWDLTRCCENRGRDLTFVVGVSVDLTGERWGKLRLKPRLFLL